MIDVRHWQSTGRINGDRTRRLVWLSFELRKRSVRMMPPWLGVRGAESNVKTPMTRLWQKFVTCVDINWCVNILDMLYDDIHVPIFYIFYFSSRGSLILSTHSCKHGLHYVYGTRKNVVSHNALSKTYLYKLFNTFIIIIILASDEISSLLFLRGDN